MESPFNEHEQDPIDHTPTRAVFREWLEKLQQESWQLELLISGLALYLVWETRKQLVQLDQFVQLNQGSDFFGDSMGLIMIMAWGTWGIFMLNLLIHILVRGMWIGAIGLRYVSGEINYKGLNYSTIFEQHLKKKVGRFDVFIEKLEQACSLIFAYTFLLFFLFLSIFMYFGLFGAGLYLSDDWMNAFESENVFLGVAAIFIYLILGFIYFIDFITLGGIKRIKDSTISKIYMVIYRLFSVITLSFLYRPLLYNFIDHYYSRRLLWFSIPYFAIVFLIAPSLNYDGYAYFPVRFKDDANQMSDEAGDLLTIKWAFYEDQRQSFISNNADLNTSGRIIDLATISSYEISDNHTQLFLRLKPYDDLYLERIKKIQPLFLTGLKHQIQRIHPEDPEKQILLDSFETQKIAFLKYKKANTALFTKFQWEEKLDSLETIWVASLQNYAADLMNQRLRAYQDIFEVTIDSINYTDSLSCKFYFHPNLGEKGLLCRLPLDSIPSGEHFMSIERKKFKRLKGLAQRDTFVTNAFYIPFYKI
ncbi:MAG: hypothetical protein KA479_11550 [Saprospiraceae bacterium]|jgi:hypothetical protein|nr:hypothetical protein [Saprospiraceae bacterium]